MRDPFADVDAASPDIIKIIVAELETKAADPNMLLVIDANLDRLDPPEGGLIVDIGCGTGGVTRRIADRFGQASVLGIEPSNALTDKARALMGEGMFGQPLADALEAEYLRRAQAGTLYGFLPFVRMIVTKPVGRGYRNPARKRHTIKPI